MFRLVGLLLTASLAGCSVIPEPIAPEDQQALLAADFHQAYADVEPVGEKVTLSEAIARGLKYNLEFRVKRMEQAIAVGMLNVAQYDMLPGVIANAGYNYRNNFFITDAVNSVSGEPSLSDPFISSARDFGVAGLSLNWSLLDFGVSYYTAKQRADQVLVAAERRRRTMHLLIQDIQVAYLRAASAQSLKTDLEETIKRARQAIEQAKFDASDGLSDPLDVLRYQKSLLDNVRLLQTINQELSVAAIEINQLLNLPANTRYQLENPDFIEAPVGYLSIPVEEFELRALMSNADLKESIYNARIALMETRKSILQLLPGINLNYGPQVTNNSFYINKNWIEGAAQISFNFWNLLMAPQVKRNAEANQALAQKRRMMVQMAVLGQVHIAKQQLDFSEFIYRKSTDIDRIDREIVTVTQQRVREGRASDAERIAADTASILSRLRRYEALGAVYAAGGRLQAVAGLEPDAGNFNDIPLSELTGAVSRTLQAWSRGELPPMNMPSQDELEPDRIASVLKRE